MDFSLNEEQNMLKDSVTKFVRDTYSYEERQKLVHSDIGFSKDHWQTFAELGWLCVPFSEEDGGIGGGPVENMLMMEELGKGLVVEPYFASVIFAGGLLASVASDEQKAELLAGIIEGQSLPTVAYAEAQAGYDLFDIKTTAKADADGYVVNGHKSFVMAGASATHFIVSARSAGDQRDESGISLVLVAADADGVSVKPCKSLDGHRVAEVTFDGAKGQLLGAEGEALPSLQSAVDDAMLALGAEVVGMMERLYKDTVEYTKTRKQFGVPIAVFQALQHRMVDMFTKQEQCKSLLLRAVLSRQQNNDSFNKDLAALKYAIGVQGQEVAHEAIQIFGGMGMTDEMSTGMYLKRINVINSLFGDADHHLARLVELS